MSDATFSLFAELIHNGTLLLALIIAYSLIVQRVPPVGPPRQVLHGLLFGAVAVAGMSLPVTLVPGVVFDGRSIVLSLSGLFGGPLAAAVAACMAAGYRVWMGGAGAGVGVGVVVTSSLAGVAFHFLRRGGRLSVGLTSLAGMALLVHLLLLAWMFLLPEAMRTTVLARITVPILTVFPVITVIVGLVLKAQEDRVETVAALARSEARYSAFFNLSLDMLSIAGTDGYFRQVNPSFARTLGYTLDEMCSRPFLDFVHPDDRERTRNELASLIQGQPVMDFENRYLCADGTIRILQWRAVADDAGQRIFAMARDITAQRANESELARRAETISAQHERMQKLLEALPVMLFELDEQGRFVRVNRHFEQVLGWDRDEVQGRDALAELSPEPDSGAQALDCLRQPNTGFTDFDTRTRDGRTLVASWASVRLSDGAAICIGIDQTESRRVRAELAQSEQRLRLITDSVPVLLSYIDAQRRYRFYNKGYLEWWHWRPGEMLGTTVRDAIGPANFESVEPMIERALCGQRVSYETSLTLPGNRFRRAHVDYVPDIDQEGGVQGFYAVISDVTEEYLLRHELEFSDALVKQSREPLYCADPEQDFRLVFVNDAACRHFGHPREDLLDLSVADLDLRFSNEHLQQLYADAQDAPVRVETEHATAAGGRLPAEVVFGVVKNEDRLLITASIRDISERRAAEQELREREALYRTLFEYIPLGIVIADARSYYRDANPAICHMLGYSHDELVGLHASDIVAETELTQIEPALRQIIGGADYFRIWRLRRQDGSIFEAEVSAKPMPDGQLLGVIQDVTERRRAESERSRLVRELRALNEQLEKRVADRTVALSAANTRLQELDRLKSLFIASMSHELRTPLNAIIGFSGLIANDMAGPISDEQRDYLQRINRSGHHLLHLITDIIDISRIEAGKIGAEPQSFDLSALVDEALQTVEQDAQKKGLRFATGIEVGGDLRTDRKRLLQCLLNFLSNAVKYSDHGVVTVRARALGGDIELSVTDQGEGIPPEQLKRLFQQFTRLDSKATRSTQGNGLGLYLTRKLAEDVLGGQVEARSRAGLGSTFVLTFPRDLQS